jgi:Family of unknown function (DUF6491)
MIVKKVAVTALAACVLVITGCATGLAHRTEAAPPSDYVTFAGPPIDGFHAFRPHSWESIGSNQLVIWSNPWDAYLLTVWPTCVGLPFANVIGLKTYTGSVSRFDSIVLPDRTRCPISDIRRIDLKKVKEARDARAAATRNLAGVAGNPETGG